MKRRSVLGLLSGMSILASIPGFAARVGVVVGVAPPAPIAEPIPPPPAPGYVWQPGYWAWNGVQYVWVPGRYVLAPFPGAIWIGGEWIRHDHHGWVWRPGHWRH